jgi:hypothetical protein
MMPFTEESISDMIVSIRRRRAFRRFLEAHGIEVRLMWSRRIGVDGAFRFFEHGQKVPLCRLKFLWKEALRR